MCTKAEKNKRISAVGKLLCLGKERAEILQYSAGTWGVSERQVDTYISEATAQIQIANTEDLAAEKAMALARNRMIFGLAIKAEQYRNALNAQDQINKLLGLYAPEKKELSGTLEVKTIADALLGLEDGNEQSGDRGS